MIKTQKQLKEKIDMLQSLVDVAVASNLMKENAKVCDAVRVWVAALPRALLVDNLFACDWLCRPRCILMMPTTRRSSAS